MAELLQAYPITELTTGSAPPSGRGTPTRDLKGSTPSSPSSSQHDTVPLALNLTQHPSKSPGFYLEAAAAALTRRRVASLSLIQALAIIPLAFQTLWLLRSTPRMKLWWLSKVE